MAEPHTHAAPIRLFRPAQGWTTVAAAVWRRIRRFWDYSMFAVLVGAVVALAITLDASSKAIALKLFAIAYFSLLPAVLYLQFSQRRTPTVWKEYVLTLFRLHADDYAHLPEPPELSRFVEPWRRERERRLEGIPDADREELPSRNVYRRRFEELYGPLPSSRERGEADKLERAHKLQVGVATVLVALGWVFVTHPESVFGRSFTPSDFHLGPLPVLPAQSIAYAFLGAYFFVLQMLVRRFFQNDLKATAYVSATMRIIVVVLLVWTLDPLLAQVAGQAWRSAFAFVVGVFPNVGWQALHQLLVRKPLGILVPSLESRLPLSDLDGMNVWYEARLVEEGVEDMQNLATADLGNVLLRTRIPGERLIDWVDQALLRLHAAPHDVDHLRRYGIRTATDLLDALACEAPGLDGAPFGAGVERLLNTPAEIRAGRPSITRSLAATLAGERNVQHVLAWRSFEPEPNLHELRLLDTVLAPHAGR